MTGPVRRRRSPGVEILPEAELKTMRRAGLVVAQGLAAMTAAARPGVTTREIDAIGADCLKSAGATSNFLGYQPGYGVPPYPAVSCQSVNDTVVHGIPGDYILRDGDLLSIDFGAIVDGHHGDAARSVLVGQADPVVERLAQVCQQATWAGIGAARLGGTIARITQAIERSVRRAGPYGIVREYTGHGIGHAMHQPPDIPNAGQPRDNVVIQAGLCLAIEPMVTLGSARVDVADDDWSVVTHDRSIAAHWENTITVTKTGCWVLTEPDGGEAMLGRLGLKYGPLAD